MCVHHVRQNCGIWRDYLPKGAGRYRDRQLRLSKLMKNSSAVDEGTDTLRSAFLVMIITFVQQESKIYISFRRICVCNCLESNVQKCK